MSVTLMAQQTALLDLLSQDNIDLIAPHADPISSNDTFYLKKSHDTIRGLRAYRAHAQALAETALAASHPVLKQLMGDENFQNLAEDFWQAMPPQRGDLAQWGASLPAYLPQVPQLDALLQECPFLLDVVRVEWALHRTATASDAELDAASFELLTTEAPTLLALKLAPSCTIVSSPYPVVAIIQLHDPRESEGYEAARHAIASGQAQTALVWRQGLRPRLRHVDAAGAALLQAAWQGQSLAQSVDAAFTQNAGFDFGAWLSDGVQSGLLLGAARMQAASADLTAR
jgi:hypothetical protein